MASDESSESVATTVEGATEAATIDALLVGTTVASEVEASETAKAQAETTQAPDVQITGATEAPEAVSSTAVPVSLPQGVTQALSDDDFQFLKQCKSSCATRGYCCNRDSGCHRPSCQLGCELAHAASSREECKSMCKEGTGLACSVQPAGFPDASTCTSCMAGADGGPGVANGTCTNACEQEMGCDLACDLFFNSTLGDCIVQGYYYKPVGSVEVKSPGVLECQQVCKANPLCHHFTYWPDTSDCIQNYNKEVGKFYLYNASEECDLRNPDVGVGERECEGDFVLSGPKSCDTEFYDMYPDLSSAHGPHGVYDPDHWACVVNGTNCSQLGTASPGREVPIIISDTTAAPAPAPDESESPEGYAARDIDGAELYEGKAPESSREVAVQNCNADIYCTGVYQGEAQQWHQLTAGASNWPQCCNEACRNENSKEATFCASPILAKSAPEGYMAGQASNVTVDSSRGLLIGASPDEAMQNCTEIEDCVGMYRSENGSWYFLKQGEETYPQCCSARCRDQFQLSQEYCKLPIYMRGEEESGQGFLGGLWPFPWWIWLLMATLIGLCAALFLMNRNKTKGGSREAKNKKKRKAIMEDAKINNSNGYQALKENAEVHPESAVDQQSEMIAPAPMGVGENTLPPDARPSKKSAVSAEQELARMDSSKKKKRDSAKGSEQPPPLPPPQAVPAPTSQKNSSEVPVPLLQAVPAPTSQKNSSEVPVPLLQAPPGAQTTTTVRPPSARGPGVTANPMFGYPYQQTAPPGAQATTTVQPPSAQGPGVTAKPLFGYPHQQTVAVNPAMYVQPGHPAMYVQTGAAPAQPTQSLSARGQQMCDEVFDMLDTDHDGFLSRREMDRLAEVLPQAQVSPSSLIPGYGQQLQQPLLPTAVHPQGVQYLVPGQPVTTVQPQQYYPTTGFTPRF